MQAHGEVIPDPSRVLVGSVVVTSGLPVVSGREAIRVLEELGYRVVRQRGSHIRLRHATAPSRKPLAIPDHAHSSQNCYDI
jgi:predicted RNA binding protein YcfA (HicA-like mRNA interferase family)